MTNLLMLHKISFLGEVLARIEWFALATLLAGLSCVTVIQVIARNTGFYIAWVEDVAALLLVWQVFLGSALAVRYGGHYTVDVFGEISGTFDRALRTLSIIIIATVLAVLAWKGIELAWKLRFRLSGAGEIQMYAYYLALPVASASAFVHLAEAILTGPKLPDFGAKV